MIRLVITAGRGPREVRQFVGQLAAWLAREVGGRVQAEAGGSVTLLAPDAAARWVGTHELIARLRGRGARSRWFAAVVARPVLPPAVAPRVTLTAARSGGPGGQNVNKRSTAVRAVDAVTGLAVRASGSRRQSENRAEAIRRLTGKLTAEQAEAASAEEAAVRSEHHRVERGNARFQWDLDARRALRRRVGPPKRTGDYEQSPS